MTFDIPPKLPESQAFDYSALDTETCNVVRQTTSRLKSLMRRSAQDIIEIGQSLIEVREQLGYGSFRKWLKAEFNWSHTAATKFIQVTQQFGCINFMQVDIAASALYLLARPSTPEEARQEALDRAALGETITHATAKEIVSQHTIDIAAEVIEEDRESPATVQPTPGTASQSASKRDQAGNEVEAPNQTQPAVPIDYKVGDRVHIEGSSNRHYNGKAASVVRVNSRHDTLTVLVDGAAPWNTVSVPMKHCTKTGTQVKAPAEPDPSRSAQPEDFSPATLSEHYSVGDRVRILHRQHGEDNWSGKMARIWQITSDGWLRVDVEGLKGVRFTLKPDWVERVEDEVIEQLDEGPEQAVNQNWAEETSPITPAIADAPPEAQLERDATFPFQAGDRLQVSILGKSNQQWTVEVSEVVQVADDHLKVTLEIPQPPK